MKKMKKMVVTVLCLAMVVGVLGACGADKGTSDTQAAKEEKTEVVKDETPTSDAVAVDDNEQLDISIWLYKDDYKIIDSYSENPVVGFLNDKFNCKLSFQQPAMGSEREQFSLMLGTGSYTDVMEISYSTEGVGSLYDDGVIRDLAPSLEQYAPNFYAFLNAPENEDVRKALYDNDGHLFTIPMALSVDDSIHWGGLVYRRDIVDLMTGGYVFFPSGNEEPTTVEDWEYFLPLMQQYFMAAGMTDYACLILPYTGYFETGELLNGFDACPSFYIKDGEVHFGPTEDAFYNYVSKMREWYEKGYIYADFASRTNDVFYLPNTALTYGAAAGTWFGLSSQLGDAMSMPEYGLEMVVNPLTSPIDTAHGATGLGYMTDDAERANMNTAGYVVSTSCSDKNLIRFLKIVDYLFTEEGAMLRTYGLTKEQGADENALYQREEIVGGAYTFDGTTFTFNEKLHPITGELPDPDCKQALDGARLPGLCINKYSVENSKEETINASAVWRSFGKGNNLPGSLGLTTDDSNTTSNNYSNYSDYMNSMIPKFIMGYEELNEQTWADYCDRLNSLGAAESLEIYSRYYNEYKNK